MALASDARNFFFPKSSPHVHDPPKKVESAQFGEPAVAERTGGGRPGVAGSDSQPYFERIEVVDALRAEVDDLRQQLFLFEEAAKGARTHECRD